MDFDNVYLLDDGKIASRLSVSRSWVRKQRFLRRHDLPHVLDIDPILVGSLPRYRASDIDRWIGRQVCSGAPTQMDIQGGTGR